MAQGANHLVMLVLRRALEMIASGHYALLGNPWLSYLWICEVVLMVAGMVGMQSVRVDRCTRGAPC